MSEKPNEGKDEPRKEVPSEEKKPRPSHIPDKNYMKLDRRILRYWLPAIGAQAVTIYELIVDCFNERLGYAYPSLPQIQEATGFGNRTVQKSIKTLEGHKLITVLRGGGKAKANRYIPLPPIVTKETIELIEKNGGKVIIDHLHLFPSSGVIPVSNDTGITSIPVANDTGTETDLMRLSIEQQQPLPVILPEEQESCQSEVVVVSDNSSKEAGSDELIAQLCEIAKIGEAKSGKAIGGMITKHGAAMVGKQLANLKRSRGIRNPVNWLRKACIENFEMDEVIHRYKAEAVKSEEQIDADAKELRQGASVDRDTAHRLAVEYESNYLRRQIKQVNRDHTLGKKRADPGKELTRRVEAGYEPEDYPPPLENDQSEENRRRNGRSGQNTKPEHDPDIGTLHADWLEEDAEVGTLHADWLEGDDKKG